MEGHRQALDQEVGHGLAQADGLAQVAAEDVPGVVRELGDDRVVEAVALVEVGAGLRRGPLLEGGLAGVTRDDPGEDERGQQDAEQDRDGADEPAEDEAQHEMGMAVAAGAGDSSPAPAYWPMRPEPCSGGRLRRRVEEASEQGPPIGEEALPADVQRGLGGPSRSEEQT